MSQGGPDHHKEEVAKSGALTPLLAKSAGLSPDLTCLQQLGGTRSRMAWTLLATNRTSCEGFLGNQYRTISLSVQAKTCEGGISKSKEVWLNTSANK